MLPEKAQAQAQGRGYVSPYRLRDEEQLKASHELNSVHMSAITTGLNRWEEEDRQIMRGRLLQWLDEKYTPLLNAEDLKTLKQQLGDKAMVLATSLEPGAFFTLLDELVIIRNTLRSYRPPQSLEGPADLQPNVPAVLMQKHDPDNHQRPPKRGRQHDLGDEQSLNPDANQSVPKRDRQEQCCLL